MVMQQKADGKLATAEGFFYAKQKENISFTRFACNPSAEENGYILTILNNHEFSASGIKDGVFDECTYKRMLCSVIIKDWNSLKAYITELRNTRNHQTLFQEFEWLANRWSENPLNLETAVGRVEGCVHRGAGLGATTLNGYSIQGRSNNAMRCEGRAIQRVAYSPNG